MAIVVGVMGPGDGAGEADVRAAYEVGARAARERWVVLTGGRAAGVMDAAARGARDAGGLVIGVLPGADLQGASDAIHVAIPTDMGHARNVINVHASSVIVACGMGCGTASEVALALKCGKPVILLGASDAAIAFFRELGRGHVMVASDPGSVIEAIHAVCTPG